MLLPFPPRLSPNRGDASNLRPTAPLGKFNLSQRFRITSGLLTSAQTQAESTGSCGTFRKIQGSSEMFQPQNVPENLFQSMSFTNCTFRLCICITSLFNRIMLERCMLYTANQSIFHLKNYPHHHCHQNKNVQRTEKRYVVQLQIVHDTDLNKPKCEK